MVLTVVNVYCVSCRPTKKAPDSSQIQTPPCCTPDARCTQFNQDRYKKHPFQLISKQSFYYYKMMIMIIIVVVVFAAYSFNI